MDTPEMEAARQLTTLLRQSESPDWRRLREFIQEQGIDPLRTVVSEIFPEDVNQRFGIAVAQDRRAFAFVLELGPRGPRSQRMREVQVSEWRELKDNLFDRYRPSIETGLALLEEEPK